MYELPLKVTSHFRLIFKFFFYYQSSCFLFCFVSALVVFRPFYLVSLFDQMTAFVIDCIVVINYKPDHLYHYKADGDLLETDSSPEIKGKINTLIFWFFQSIFSLSLIKIFPTSRWSLKTRVISVSRLPMRKSSFLTDGSKVWNFSILCCSWIMHLTYVPDITF